MFIPRAQPNAQSLFLIQIVFGVNSTFSRAFWHRRHLPGLRKSGFLEATLDEKNQLVWTPDRRNGAVKLFYYRKRGSASYIVSEVRSVWERERDTEREREIDGSDVIIVALKLAMSLHFPMPKIRTIAVKSHFTLPKNRTFRFSLHTSCLTIVALKFAVHTFRCQKIRPLSSDSLLIGASRATSDRKPKTKDQFCPVLLFFPSKKWIKSIPKNYWK